MKILLAIPYLAMGISLIVVSIPLIQGKIGPNAWYGFRVRRTLEDPKLWYAVNRYSAYHLMGLGVLILATATICYALPSVGFIAEALICLGVTLAGLAFGLIRSFKKLSELSRSDS